MNPKMLRVTQRIIERSQKPVLPTSPVLNRRNPRLFTVRSWLAATWRTVSLPASPKIKPL